MTKQQSAQFLFNLVNDYSTQLTKQGHKQLAELAKANGHSAISSLMQDGSSEQVPDAHDQD